MIAAVDVPRVRERHLVKGEKERERVREKKSTRVWVRMRAHGFKRRNEVIAERKGLKKKKKKK